VDLLEQTLDGAREVEERLGAHHAAGQFRGDPEDHVAAALVGDGRAVPRQLVEGAGVPGLLELDVLVFTGGQPLFNLLESDHDGGPPRASRDAS